MSQSTQKEGDSTGWIGKEFEGGWLADKLKSIAWPFLNLSSVEQPRPEIYTKKRVAKRIVKSKLGKEMKSN